MRSSPSSRGFFIDFLLSFLLVCFLVVITLISFSKIVNLELQDFLDLLDFHNLDI